MVLPEVRAGRAQFSDNYVISSTGPNAARALSVAQVASERCVPRVLMLGGAGSGDEAGFFPSSESGSGAAFGYGYGTYQAGLADSLGAPDWATAIARAACVVEYGAGAVQNRVVMDWRIGSYQLPPCTFARVAVYAWGAGWPDVASLNAAGFAASIVEGEFERGQVPTVSGIVKMEAVSRSFMAPRKASAFDVQITGSANIGRITVSAPHSCPRVVRDNALYLQNPPWGPVLLAPNAYDVMTFATDVAVNPMYVVTTFYLSL